MGKTDSTPLSDAPTRRILDLLQADGRMTVQALADEVGLSSAPCWRRLRELEDSGIIRRFVALVDRNKVGLHGCMFTQISLERHSETVVAAFERAVQATPEILECWVTTGDGDYILKIVVPDALAFVRFLHRFMLKLEGIRQIKTSVALREVKNDTRLDLTRVPL